MSTPQDSKRYLYNPIEDTFDVSLSFNSNRILTSAYILAYYVYPAISEPSYTPVINPLGSQVMTDSNGNVIVVGT
jgi:hypothetical protein